MFSKSIAVLALATGLATAKPVNKPQTLPVYKRDSFGNGFNNGFGNGFSNDVSFNNGFGGNGFDFIGGFNNFDRQQQVLQVQQQNFQLIDNGGFQQQVFEQVNQVLVIDGEQNGFNNNLNDLFRTTNVRRNFRDVTTVMMVVTQVNVAIDDGRGGVFQQEVFAQSLLVANRGQRETQSVMLFDSRTLIAADILGRGRSNGFDFGRINNNGINLIGRGAGIGGRDGVAAPSDVAALPTKTHGVQILGAKPTWTSIIEDPASTNGAVWSAEIQALQKAEADAADNEINNQVAQQLKAQQAAPAPAVTSAPAQAPAQAQQVQAQQVQAQAASKKQQ